MNDKFIKVLLSITVPNSPFCYHKEKGFRCQYFSPLIGCYNGFNPERISDTIYGKDKECESLLWVENLK